MAELAGVREPLSVNRLNSRLFPQSVACGGVPKGGRGAGRLVIFPASPYNLLFSGDCRRQPTGAHKHVAIKSSEAIEVEYTQDVSGSAGGHLRDRAVGGRPVARAGTEQAASGTSRGRESRAAHAFTGGLVPGHDYQPKRRARRRRGDGTLIVGRGCRHAGGAW